MTHRSTDTDAAAGELIFIEPVFLAKVWGGSRLHDLLGYELPAGRIGECLAVSARPEGDCRIRGGRFAGTTLSALWNEHRGLFGDLDGDAFPLQIKILDACDDLSVQVHPDERYAAAHESDSGKSECWYVLRPSETGRILIGHFAQTRAEFARLARAGHWDELLRRIEMREGDFFLIPAGTVHAVLAGSMIYEVQQPSNLTYRLFDYDRLDNGVKRELHVEKALDVVAAPSLPGALGPVVTTCEGATIRAYPRNERFALSRWEVDGELSVPMEAPFLIAGVLEGTGTINGVRVAAGDHLIVPCGVETVEVAGRLAIMVTTV